jgi:GNAT superfamily N-acetyltransferase
MNIEFTKSPVAADIDFLTQKINHETPHYGEAYPFAFFIRNEDGQIIAGCNGSVIYGSIYTDQLWVDKKSRRIGFGRDLMDQVHMLGAKSGCTMATISTMSFQGVLSFYKKLGYVMDFERKGYVHNSSCIFLKKQL